MKCQTHELGNLIYRDEFINFYKLAKRGVYTKPVSQWENIFILFHRVKLSKNFYWVHALKLINYSLKYDFDLSSHTKVKNIDYN